MRLSMLPLALLFACTASPDGGRMESADVCEIGMECVYDNCSDVESVAGIILCADECRLDGEFGPMATGVDAAECDLTGCGLPSDWTCEAAF